jgi:hypothetical protein
MDERARPSGRSRIIAEDSQMPIKSQAQRRKFAELLTKGEISPEVYERWNREAGSKELPEHVKPKAKRASKARPKRTTASKTTNKRKTTAKRETATRGKTAKRSRR